MKQGTSLFLFALLLFLGDMHARSQVWNGDLTFASQAEIDDFANFSYTSVNGRLIIMDDYDGVHNITNLAGLAGLTSVTGFVEIIFNDRLVNTAFLNLVSVGGLRIGSNAALTSINNLPLTSASLGLTIENNSSLTGITAFSPLTATGQLIVQNNPLLTNLSGFGNLTTVSGSLILGNNNSMTNLNSFSKLQESNGLIVRNNPALANINGLANVARVGQLTISNNPLLENIDGLIKLTTVTSSIEIDHNPLLQNVSGLASLMTANTASIYIHHNNVLQNINGPDGVHRIGLLRIEENAALTGISGFSRVDTAGGIEILRNPALTHISAFPELAFILGSFISINNYILENIAPMPLLDSIGGELTIVLDTLLTNLDYIPNIRGIRGRLWIGGNPHLSNISGLSHLRSVSGDILISNNPLITSISPLSGITEIKNRLLITGMAGLQSLTGLHNITRVAVDLNIVGNPQLATLNGLISIDSIGRDLVIASNALITNLSGLRNLRKANLVAIQQNPALSDFCGLYTLYANGGPPGGTAIFQNLVNPTPEQIFAAGPCASAPLPVVLKVFNMKCEGTQVTLNWITANEYNNSHFILQRSIDGLAWTSLATVKAVGNNANEQKYIFKDNSPLPNGFYRLAQYDIDGRVHHSSVLRSGCAVQNDFSIWPNPAIDKVVISIQSSDGFAALMRIFDSRGALVQSRKLVMLPGRNQFEINIKDIPQGIYIVKVEDENGRLQENRLLLKK